MNRPRERKWRTGAWPPAAATWMLLAATGCGEPQPPKMVHGTVLAQVRTVAVLPFVDAPGDTAKGSGQTVVNATIAALYQCPGLRVIERSRLDAIANEADLKISGQLSVDDATKLGKLAGADAIILGEVTQYEAQQEYSHLAVDVVSGGGTRRIHRVGLSIRAVNVVDGCVIFAELGQGTSNEGYSEAAKDAARKAIQPWREFCEYHNAPKKAPK